MNMKSKKFMRRKKFKKNFKHIKKSKQKKYKMKAQNTYYNNNLRHLSGSDLRKLQYDRLLSEERRLNDILFDKWHENAQHRIAAL